MIMPNVVMMPGVQSSIPGATLRSCRFQRTAKPSINIHQPKANYKGSMSISVLLRYPNVTMYRYQNTSEIDAYLLSFVSKTTEYSTTPKHTRIIAAVIHVYYIKRERERKRKKLKLCKAKSRRFSNRRIK